MRASTKQIAPPPAKASALFFKMRFGGKKPGFLSERTLYSAPIKKRALIVNRAEDIFSLPFNKAKLPLCRRFIHKNSINNKS